MLVGTGGDLVVIAGIVVLIFGIERLLPHLGHGLRLVITRCASTHTRGLTSLKERLSKPEPPICSQVTTSYYD